MKRLGFLAIALSLGCNATSDGDTDTDGNTGGGSSASDTDNITTQTDTATASDSADTASASASATSGDESSGTTGGSSSEGSSSGGSSSEGGSSGGSSSEGSSSTGELDAQGLCETSDGTWEPNACGDYVCGVPNDCEAIIPGCDCGPDANFVEGEGCVADAVCTTFDCGDEVQCVTALQYCVTTFPGVKGADPTYECEPMPKECADSVDCECLQEAVDLPPPGFCSEPTPDGLVVQVFLP